MVTSLPRLESRKLVVVFVALLLMAAIGCGGSSGFVGGGTPTPTPTPIPTPTPTPTPTPVPPPILSIKVGDATVPPGGMFQYQLLLTEPKPIGNSSTRPSIPIGPTGPVRGVAINDPSGQAVGIALINGTNIAVSAMAPNFPPTFGTDVTYPLFTMAMPVLSTATVGTTFPVDLDPSAAFFDGSGTLYPQETITPGTLTIGGTLSITDVLPGGGLLPDRSTIRVKGIGFTSNTRITIEGTTVFFTAADTKLVDPNTIDVVICNDVITDPLATVCPNPSPVPNGTGPSLQLDGERVRAIDKNTGETIQYFTYQRADDESGASANVLVTQVHPMYSRLTYNVGSIPYVKDATHFTGMSVQNTSATDALFKVELLDAGNAVVGSATGISVRASKKITRDIQDWIPSPTGTPVTVRVTVTSGPAAGLQMLGMLGDTTAGTVTPVVVK